jgi:hypothetical protein
MLIIPARKLGNFSPTVLALRSVTLFVVREMLQIVAISIGPLEGLGGALFMKRTLELGIGLPRIGNVRLGRGLAGFDKRA